MQREYLAQTEHELERVKRDLQSYGELVRYKEALEAILEFRPASKQIDEPKPQEENRVIAIIRKPPNRFQPNPESKEMLFGKAFRDFLASQASGQAAFLDGYRAVIRSDPALTSMSKEYGRSALARVGRRVGLIYESAARVRLIGDEKQDPGALAFGP